MDADRPITEADVREFLERFEEASATRLFAGVEGMIHPDAFFRFNDGDHRGSRPSVPPSRAHGPTM